MRGHARRSVGRLQLASHTPGPSRAIMDTTMKRFPLPASGLSAHRLMRRSVDELDESESNEESTGAVEALERDDIPGVSDSECRCPCAHANGRQLTDTQPGKPWSGVRRRRSVLRTRRRAERPDDDELFASDAADDTNGCRGRAAA